jgi:hypothetical protein
MCGSSGPRTSERNTLTMTLSSPTGMRKASISSPDYADLASPEPLLCKGSAHNLGITRTSA